MWFVGIWFKLRTKQWKAVFIINHSAIYCLCKRQGNLPLIKVGSDLPYCLCCSDIQGTDWLATGTAEWRLHIFCAWCTHGKLRVSSTMNLLLFWNASLVSVMSLRGHMTAELYSREIQEYFQLHTQCVWASLHILIDSHGSVPVNLTSHSTSLTSPICWVLRCAKLCAECFAYFVLSNPQINDVKWFLDQNYFSRCDTRCDRRMQPVLLKKKKVTLAHRSGKSESLSYLNSAWSRGSLKPSALDRSPSSAPLSSVWALLSGRLPSWWSLTAYSLPDSL